MMLPVLAGAGVFASVAQAAPPPGTPAHAPAQNWSFKGPLGHFDLAAVQRGYAVFAGVCASCHSLTQVQFSDLGAMGLTSDQVAALAASWQVAAGRDAEGHLRHRKATPDDMLPRPYADADAARAANRGAVPPDLSRITQVYPGGADRVYALLTGYKPAQTLPLATGPDAAVRRVPARPETGFVNPYAIGHITAMPPPLRDNAVPYADGTQPTAQQEARDVTTFLAWVSIPHADDKRRLGVGVGLYLCFLACLLVILKRRIWSHVTK
ncbi:ubiquinol-cytochrome c reductase cytochrome c1 [Acetobacter orleanensis NRIC 0473]|nr:ubiquinol-cytochrome c reductase cytochrome c1 [Acetobacter orleanensis NRIC 0473]